MYDEEHDELILVNSVVRHTVESELKCDIGLSDLGILRDALSSVNNESVGEDVIDGEQLFNFYFLIVFDCF